VPGAILTLATASFLLPVPMKVTDDITNLH